MKAWLRPGCQALQDAYARKHCSSQTASSFTGTHSRFENLIQAYIDTVNQFAAHDRATTILASYKKGEAAIERPCIGLRTNDNVHFNASTDQ